MGVASEWLTSLHLLCCHVEANYAYQQELDMIPLMMQKDYSPKGYVCAQLLSRLCNTTEAWLTLFVLMATTGGWVSS